ncbi:carboxylesterase/lipase family protein [Granulicella sp. S190]|uniref:carboxylesterase/lipase family protein n=1 Tax=Granulicella sp. S190 TaxID=1747226 RepID=UPI00131E682C|nr:carboxylesterase family protein [Granulicella sp. S190]
MPWCPSKVFLSAAILLSSAAAHAANPLRVKTDKGKVQGALTTDQKVIAFKGIPFAAPPIGGLRWQSPQPAAKWSGTRSAKDFGPHCIQSSGYDDMTFHDPGPSEDCLTLNVWTPANARPGTLPVMVWIYGGGYRAGSTSENRQDGQFLAHRNVIVVSMNYRLGIFGFFVHPELTAESPHHASGNYGLLDQAAAIAWVKQNIKAFGGDPNNITIFGESAGSFSVSSQMASPLTKDLISKAIGESGGAFRGLGYQTREARETTDSQFAQSAYGTTSLAALRKLSVDDILKGATAKSDPPPPHFEPDVDGYFLPDSVPNIFAAGKQAHIPLLAGWNADEDRGTVIFAHTKPTAASFTSLAKLEFGPDAEKFLSVYPATTDEEAQRSAGDYAGARFITFSTWRWLEAHVDTGKSPVYRYSLDLGSPGDKYHAAALGAFHSDDIEYVFSTLDSRNVAVWRPEDRKLSDQIGAYWTNFARTGDPNGPGLPVWPTYNAPGNWQVMHLDANSQARPDDHRDRFLFLNQAWTNPKSTAQ